MRRRGATALAVVLTTILGACAPEEPASHSGWVTGSNTNRSTHVAVAGLNG